MVIFKYIQYNVTLEREQRVLIRLNELMMITDA